ncbi:CLOCK-interacting pacemaker [Ambystoma mexicanum]|uniref:CLOCK-interacting pacemaker n=1 Tax=Ambystoma mexicanum TaxID=8296 RepID=UPI0037E7DFC9
MEGKHLSTGTQKTALSRLSKVPEMKQRALFLGMAAAESDKDSGFSDGASDCQSSMEQGESEDVNGVLCWSAKDATQPDPGTKTGPFTTLSPVLMMNNVFFRQTNSAVPQSWAVHPSFEVMSQAQPQIILLPPTATPLLSPPAVSERRGYLPILNSYAKIAPHPTRDSLASHTAESADADGPRRQKRLRLEKHAMDASDPLPVKSDVLTVKNDVLPMKIDVLARKSTQAPLGFIGGTTTPLKFSASKAWHSSPTLVESTPALKLKPNTSIETPMAPSLIIEACQSQTLEISETDMPSLKKVAVCSTPRLGEPSGPSPLSVQEQQSKSKRFQNTLDVLHRSGLLEITMKTKELARQNRATQAELDHLKEQMQLFMEAMQSSLPQAWAKLYESLSTTAPKAESGLADTGMLQVSLESFGM